MGMGVCLFFGLLFIKRGRVEMVVGVWYVVKKCVGLVESYGVFFE